MAYAQPVVATAGLATNVNVTAPASAVFDGFTVFAGQRVLLVGQSTQSQNGVWLFNGTGFPMTRPTAVQDQYKIHNTLDNATLIPVTNGNTFAGTCWGIDPAAVVIVDNPASGAHTLTRVALPPVQARVATTGNINLTATLTIIDGISLVGNGLDGSDIVLVKNQTTPSQNGLYWANTGGAMNRTTEPLPPNRAVLVSEGTVNAHTHHVMVTQGAIVIGTTSLTFSRQFTAANVRDFGAVGDGTTADHAAFLAASNAGGADIAVPPGTYRFSSNVTLPATQTLRFANGAVLKPDNGVTTTINGPVDVPPNQQAFSNVGTGLGTVLLPKAGPVSPVWFGAVGDGVAFDDLPVSATVAALGGSSGVVHVAQGNTHRLVNNLTVPANVHLVFDQGSQLKMETTATLTIDGQVTASPRSGIFAFVTKAVSGATNASPIVITTSTAHGLSTGMTVLITGVAGNQAANGVWQVTVTSSTQFSLDGSTGNGTYTSGGAVQSTANLPSQDCVWWHWFGATATSSTNGGGTDDTAAIQAATNSISRQAGQLGSAQQSAARCTGAPGYYRIATSIALQGCGLVFGGLGATFGSTVLNFDNGAGRNDDAGIDLGCLIVERRSPFFPLLRADGAKIHDLTLMQGTGGQIGWLMTGQEALALTKSTAIKVYAPATTLENLLIQGFTGNAISIAGDSTPEHVADDVTFQGTIVALNCGVYGVHSHGGDSSANKFGGTLVIENCGAWGVVDSSFLGSGWGTIHTAENGFTPWVRGTVTSATNASPIVLTIEPNAGLSTGDTVSVNGVVGNTAANGTWTITTVSQTSTTQTFQLNGSSGNGTYAQGGTVYTAWIHGQSPVTTKMWAPNRPAVLGDVVLPTLPFILAHPTMGRYVWRVTNIGSGTFASSGGFNNTGEPDWSTAPNNPLINPPGNPPNTFSVTDTNNVAYTVSIEEGGGYARGVAFNGGNSSIDFFYSEDDQAASQFNSCSYAGCNNDLTPAVTATPLHGYGRGRLLHHDVYTYRDDGTVLTPAPDFPVHIAVGGPYNAANVALHFDADPVFGVPDNPFLVPPWYSDRANALRDGIRGARPDRRDRSCALPRSGRAQHHQVHGVAGRPDERRHSCGIGRVLVAHVFQRMRADRDGDGNERRPRRCGVECREHQALVRRDERTTDHVGSLHLPRFPPVARRTVASRPLPSESA